MKKKLITIKNYLDYVCDGKFIVTSNMIITPGAKDKIRAANLETIYEKEKCCVAHENKNEGTCKKNGCEGNRNEIKSNEELEKKIIEILLKKFNITDVERVKVILKKVKESIK